MQQQLNRLIGVGSFFKNMSHMFDYSFSFFHRNVPAIWHPVNLDRPAQCIFARFHLFIEMYTGPFRPVAANLHGISI